MTTQTTHSSSFSDPLERSILEVCDSIGEVIEYWGFKRVQGRIWAYLSLSSQPRSQTDIASTLHISKSLVSSTISDLTELNLVRPTSSQRNAPYEANLDIWPVVSNILRSREWILLEQVRMALLLAKEELALSTLDSESHSPPPFNPEHVNLLLTMVELAQSVLRTILTIRTPEPPQVTQSWVQRASSLLAGFRRKKPLPTTTESP